MTFDLNSIRKTKRDTPPRVLLYGEHKIGKSTWASCAPGAIFIPTEDGQDNLDADAFPLCHTWDDLLTAVGTLYNEEHTFKTCIVDSIDWAEKLAQRQVCSEHKDKNGQPYTGIEQFGYGKGYTYAAELFGEMLDGLNALRKQRGMAIIMICHTEIKAFNDPQTESYDRYQLKLHKMIAKVVQEWSDVIGFAQLATTTKKEDQGFKKERNIVKDLNKRVLRLAPNAAFDAGNRYDLPAELPLVWDDFEQALNEARA